MIPRRAIAVIVLVGCVGAIVGCSSGEDVDPRFPGAHRVGVHDEAIGFRSGDAGVSIDLKPFIQGDSITLGGRFVVNVNHRGYRSYR